LPGLQLSLALANIFASIWKWRWPILDNAAQTLMTTAIGFGMAIGNLITVASSRFDTPLVFAGALTTAFMGVGMYALANIVEKRTIGWATRGMDSNQVSGYGV
jgi:ABC-type nitrate/sulfonate/bicarbonate transport system permease component